MTDNNNGAAPAISIRGGSLAFGARTLWKDLPSTSAQANTSPCSDPTAPASPPSSKRSRPDRTQRRRHLRARQTRTSGQRRRRLRTAAEVPSPPPPRCAPATSWDLAWTGTAGASACTVANTAPRLTNSSKPSARPNTRTCRWAFSPAVSSSACVSPGARERPEDSAG